MSDLDSELQGLLADVGATPDNSCATQPQETEAKLVDKEQTLPDIEAKPESKAQYQAIPADQKTVVEGSPMTSTVYPKGYVQFKWPASRFPNNAPSTLTSWMHWKHRKAQTTRLQAQLVAAGLRIKDQRKGG